MSTILKVIASVVAAGSGLVGVLGQTRDKDTGRLKPLGWWSAALVCLAGIVALGLAWSDYVASRARQQRESERDRVVQEQPIGQDEERVGSLPGHHGKRALDLFLSLHP
jgi:hypothetical protein